MVEISVLREGEIFLVKVSEDNSTEHTVMMSQQSFDDLRAGKPISPEEFVKKSFEFLLEREPKESILSEFDITVISRYFPEYKEKIKKMLSG